MIPLVKKESAQIQMLCMSTWKNPKHQIVIKKQKVALSQNSELINQKILGSKKSGYGDSFWLIEDKEKETLDKTTSHDSIDNIENNDNRSEPDININPQPFTFRDEQNILKKCHLLENL